MDDAPDSTVGQKESVRGRGTAWQRFFIGLLTAILTALIYWLLGFVLYDIAQIPGPQFEEIEAKLLDPVLKKKSDELAKEIANTERDITNQTHRQELLRSSTGAAQQTLNQLLEIQRLSIEQNSDLSDEQRTALAESQELFLENQRRDQELNESRAELNERLVALREDAAQNNTELENARVAVHKEFNEQTDRHRLKLATLQMAVLAPLWAAAAWLFLRLRESVYVPLIYAFGLALLLRSIGVMHEYFPRQYFKYIIIIAATCAIGWILYRLLQLVARPNRSLRHKQYREAYQAYVCPMCRFPIRRGPLRYLPWSAQGATAMAGGADPAVVDTPHTCPACATKLFEACEKCGQTRYALLPACEHCGAVKDV